MVFGTSSWKNQDIGKSEHRKTGTSEHLIFRPSFIFILAVGRSEFANSLKQTYGSDVPMFRFPDVPMFRFPDAFLCLAASYSTIEAAIPAFSDSTRGE